MPEDTRDQRRARRRARRRRSIDDEFHAPWHWRTVGRSVSVGIISLSALVLTFHYSWWWPVTAACVVACFVGDRGVTRGTTLRQLVPYVALTVVGGLGGLASLLLLGQ